MAIDAKIKEKIELESKKVTGIIQSAKKDVANGQKGILRIATRNGNPQYYRKVDKNKEEYISKKDFASVKQLAQKEYALKVLTQAEKMQKVLSSFSKNYNSGYADTIYKKLSAERQKLVRPYDISDKEYAENWLKEEYKKKEFSPDFPVYTTERGERVRSKSEIIIANKLNACGLKYKYERPLKLNSELTYYPDFTILNERTRQEWILEHFGMLDDRNYLESTIVKLLNYAEKGLTIGNGLIVTFETINQPFQIRYLEHLLDTYLY